MANEYFSPLREAGRALSENIGNTARAAIGQGLMFSAGDEAEAAARAAVSGRSVSEELADIQRDYNAYRKAHPVASGYSEFVGGFIPSALAMLVPGGQPVAVANAPRLLSPLYRAYQGIKGLAGAGKNIGQRTLAENVARGTMIGTGQGALTGFAGADNNVDARLRGAGVGAGIGAGLGLTFGLGIPALGAVGARIGEAFPSAESIKEAALRRIWRKLGPVSPDELEQKLIEDQAMGVPSMPMNINRGSVREAETMAQRPGESAEIIGEAIGRQRQNVGERVVGQIEDRLSPTNYFEERQQLAEELLNRARPLYQAAEAVGDVTDPVILQLMQHPQIRQAFNVAKNASDIRQQTARAFGEDPAQFQLSKIMMPTGNFDPAAVKALRDMGIPENKITEYLSNAGESALEMSEQMVPDVKTLHQIKLGLDNMVNAAYASENKAQRQSAEALKELRDRFLARFEEVVPEYKQARLFYSDQKTIEDAMDTGYNMFLKMKPEELAQAWKAVSSEGAEAFRIGAARALQGLVTESASSRDFAKRVLGSPDMQEKLKTIFPSQAQYNLFVAALQRESEMYQQAAKVLAGSPTAARLAAAAEFENNPMGAAASAFVNQGFASGLLNTVLGYMSKAAVPDDVANQIAKYLTSNDPLELAAAMRAMEKTLSQTGKASGAIAAGVPAGTMSVVSGADSGSDRRAEAAQMGFSDTDELTEEEQAQRETILREFQ
jgi:hypothetical protein